MKFAEWQQIAGQPLAKKKKVYLDTAPRLQALVAQHTSNSEGDENDDNNDDSLMRYLKGIAHNITFTQ